MDYESKIIVENCRYILKDVQEKRMQQFKNSILDICNIIEKYHNDKCSKDLVIILEIIIYNITQDPNRIDLIKNHMINFQNMLSDIIFIENEREVIKEKIKREINIEHSTKHNYKRQLNLFNSDGSRCSVEEILNS